MSVEQPEVFKKVRVLNAAINAPTGTKGLADKIPGNARGRRYATAATS
jgi:hypothetical protein